MQARTTLALLGLALAACTGEPGGGMSAGRRDAPGATPEPRGGADAAWAAAPDACALFERDVVARAFATTIDPLSERATMGRTDSGTRRRGCAWEAAGAGLDRYSFHVVVETYATAEAAARAYDQARTSPDLAHVDEVPGLGDAAMYARGAETPPSRAALRWRVDHVLYELGVARPAGLDAAAARAALTGIVAATF